MEIDNKYKNFELLSNNVYKDRRKDEKNRFQLQKNSIYLPIWRNINQMFRKQNIQH